MKIKLSATFEGKCSICGKEATVFTAGDEDTHKTVTVCKECAGSLGNETTSQVIEEYGKVDDEAFKEGIKIEKGDATRDKN
jgi:transcription elongation factor Elf1